MVIDNTIIASGRCITPPNTRSLPRMAPTFLSHTKKGISVTMVAGWLLAAVPTILFCGRRPNNDRGREPMPTCMVWCLDGGDRHVSTCCAVLCCAVLCCAILFLAWSMHGVSTSWTVVAICCHNTERGADEDEEEEDFVVWGQWCFLWCLWNEWVW